ncbi:SDR family NAD(P)-dependent oxidoreductase [Desulfospira joergensenii]|uniref:SDR family NAD(P)-dependent oxidoreductase n=1 Tax=Desulfospira joergensenii TaxID=53329 RepID=UPI0003B5A504|nr:SDR family oxidoreductase [Desulfospira joergensenii]
MITFKGKTAVITGGSDGIGFAIAETFAAHGADLVIVGRNPDKLVEKAHGLTLNGTHVLPVATDMAQEGAVEKIFHAVEKQGIRVDILINNAGIARFIPFSKTSEADFDRHFSLNVRVPYLLTQVFLGHLTATRGNVINLSSYFAKRMLKDRPSTVYSATKGAVESFTRALAFELGPLGVRINAIAPGTVATPQVAYNYGRLDDGAKNRFDAMIRSIYPLQRIGAGADVAKMALFLASKNAAWITGGIFPVDGGLTTN